MSDQTTNRVFLSSRLNPELEAVREALKQTIHSRTPFKLECGDRTTGAKSGRTTDVSLAKLRSCNFIIVLVDGSIGPDTRAEWRESIRLKMPHLIYFSEETTSAVQKEILDDVYAGLDKSQKGIWSRFENSESGADKIVIDLLQDPASKSQNSTTPSLVDEILQYFEYSGRSPSEVSTEPSDWGFFSVLNEDQENELIACQPSQINIEGIEHVAARARAEGYKRFRIVTDASFPQLLRSRAASEGGIVQMVNDLLMELTDIESCFKEIELRISEQAVTDRYVELECDVQIVDGQFNEFGTDRCGALHDYVLEWASAPLRRQLALLGDFGSGKSWYCLHFGQSMIQMVRGMKPSRMPVLIELLSLADAHGADDSIDLVGYVAQKLGIDQFSRALTEALVANGRLVVILDGFDELVPHIDAVKRRKALSDLTELSAGEGKTLLTSRRANFENVQSEARELRAGGVYDGAVRFEIIYLSEMNSVQITQKIEKRFGAAAPKLLRRLAALPTLQSLVRRPIVLDMVLTILIDSSEEDSQKLTLFDVYQRCAKRWLQRAARAKSPLSEQKSFELMRRLAWELYHSGTRDDIGQDRLSELLDEIVFEIQENLVIGDIEIEPRARSEMLLVRDNRGKFAFAHRSFMEFFVAAEMMCAIEEGDLGRFGEIAINDAILAFLRTQSLEAPRLLSFLENSKDKSSDWRAGNLITLLQAIGAPLAKGDFSRLIIKDAILEGANLQGASFENSELHRLRIGGADLGRANFSGAKVKGLILGVKSSTKSVASSPVAPLVAASNAQDEILLIDANTKDVPIILGKHDDSVTRVAFSPDGELLASVAFDNQLKIWSVSERKLLKDITLGKGTTYSVSLDLQDYGVALTGGNDNTVRAWSLADGNEGISLAQHQDAIYAIVGNSERRRFATASFDRTIVSYTLCDPQLGFRVETVRRFEGHKSLVNGVAIDPEGKTLACCDNEGMIYVRGWTGKRFSEKAKAFKGHESQIWSLAFSPDGKHAVTGATDQSIAVWDCENNWRRVAVLKGHQGAVWQTAFVAGGDLIVSCGNDSTVRLWDWRCGEETRCEFMGSPNDPGLKCAGAAMADVDGLSDLQKEFLSNLGATVS